ncbi:MAG: DnaD domain protein [Acutalibacteraceae bacterium]
MDYYINPQILTAVFTVPTAVVDRYFKLAKAEHIKILLYVLRHMTDDLTDSAISDACGVSEYEVKEALLYWSDAGLLLPKTEPPKPEKKDKPMVERVVKPSRSDVINRALTDENFRWLLNQAEIKFGRMLKESEKISFLWLYEDMGIKSSLILLIIQHALERNRANIGYIESVALSWKDKGINDVVAADDELRKMALKDVAWNTVSSAFGLERRQPSAKEAELSEKWINEWNISKEMLTLAYDECINRKSKFSFSYVAKIIESWHKKGYKAPEDIEENTKKRKEKNDFASYDIDLYEKMLNSKD